MVHQSISSFKHVFFSSSSIIFGYQLDFYLLRQYGLESSGSFHFVFEFLNISCPFIDDVKVTACKFKMYVYKDIDNVYDAYMKKQRSKRGI